MKNKFLIVVVSTSLLLGLFYFFIFRQGFLPSKHQIPLDTSVIVLSPHFDDAVLSLGGLLGQLGTKAMVVTFFTKEDETIQKTYWDEISGFSNSREAIEKRTSENTNALSVLGNRWINYSFNDLQYDESRNSENLKKELVKSIENLLAHNTGQVFVYAPAKFQESVGNPDHHLLHDAIVEVAKKNTDSRLQFFIYEDYPYIEKSDFSVHEMEKLLQKKNYTEATKYYISLDRNDVERKLTAMKEYSSQIRAFDVLNENLIGGLEKFNNRRCWLNDTYACEVVYQLRTP